MTLRRLHRTLLTGAFLLALPHPALASGGDGYAENSFAPEHYVTEAEIAAYAGGKLGVIPATYWRIYHLLAYRAASGEALTPAEVNSLGIAGWTVHGLHGYWRPLDDKSNGVGPWRQARLAMPGVADVTIRVEGSASDYVGFINCQEDAFRRATATLAERRQRDGGQWAAAWLAGQDAVFANCADSRPWGERKGPPEVRLPPAPPAGAPDWLVRDRAYQNAAALFYAGHYDAARERFLAIARDNRSPWQPTGAYLAARCLIRKATLQVPPAVPSDGKPVATFNQALLQQARAELAAIAGSQPPAKALIGWVDARLRPAERLAELGKALARGRLGGDSPQQLADYIHLLDKTPRTAMMAAAEPMTVWIGAMQATVEDDPWNEQPEQLQVRRSQAMTLARQRWQAGRDPLWLLPLLTHAQAGEASEAETRAAAAVAPDSPLHQALQYHLARLALQEGHADRADALVTTLLAKPAQSMSVATRNRWLGLKLVSAPSADAFLQAAPRQIAESQSGVPIPDEGKVPPPSGLGLDEDFPRRLYRDLPFSELKAFLRRPDFPEAERRRLTEVVWTRAVLLGDFATATELADELAQGRATTRHLYERLKAAQGDEAKRLAATLILVNTPELDPNNFDSQGSERHWGCPVPSYGVRADPLLAVPLSYPSAAMRADTAREQKILAPLPLRSAYLAPALFAWVKSKPNDPEAPKALHFLVASTRLECQSLPYTDKPPKASHSKEAFQLLHKLYPKSEWAAKTKYFF